MISMDVFANDEDADGELVLELTQIRAQPQHGEIALNKTTGMLVYTPATGFVGTDYFDYSVIDNDGLASEPARVTIDVTPAVGNSWQNPMNPLDVNDDAFVSSIDALLILNVINRGGAGPLSFPTADESATALSGRDRRRIHFAAGRAVGAERGQSNRGDHGGTLLSAEGEPPRDVAALCLTGRSRRAGRRRRRCLV